MLLNLLDTSQFDLCKLHILYKNHVGNECVDLVDYYMDKETSLEVTWSTINIQAYKKMLQNLKKNVIESKLTQTPILKSVFGIYYHFFVFVKYIIY